ncbi:MAG: nucleoside kinase [Spirochaetales bacterium]|nr:nucleoside kinase [Spirochaetales bacterium]
MEIIKVEYEKNRIEQVPHGTKIKDLIEGIESYAKIEGEMAGVMFNNYPAALTKRINHEAEISPIMINSKEGREMYKSTLNFLLTMASTELFPDKKFLIGGAISEGIFFNYSNDKDLTEETIKMLRDKMKSYIDSKLLIEEVRVSYCDAIDYFKEKKRTTALSRLEYINSDSIILFKCKNYLDFTDGPLIDNAEKIKNFDLRKYENGLLIREPIDLKAFKIGEFHNRSIIYKIHKEYTEWGKSVKLNSSGDLNNIIQSGNIKEFIRINENLHDFRINQIASEIKDNAHKIKTVLIAGPSSSGKTTFTKKLATSLQMNGLSPIIISLDDFFLPKEQTPIDEDGKYDFESIKAIDVELLNKKLLELFQGKPTEMPIFDFKKSRRSKVGRILTMTENNILLMEGIHGLNPELTPRIPEDTKFKIYVSALTQLRLDSHNRIQTTENRLIRRLVRDSQFRGQSANGTLEMWPSVRRGEDKNIFPFQGNADVAFNSALDYELPVLKLFAEPLLRTVKPFHPYYGKAVKLQELFANFLPIAPEEVPNYSILREFIGKSGFKY